MRRPAFLFLALLSMSCNPVGSDLESCRTFDSASTWGRAGAYVLQDLGVSDNTVLVRSQWDRDSLYFRFEASDSILWATQTEHDDKLLYLDDMCEVLLDPRNDRSDEWLEDDLIYHVNLLGAVKDDRGEPGGGKNVAWDGQGLCSVDIKGVVCDSLSLSGGYVVRIAIPWIEIGLKPGRGVSMGLNFGFSDRDGTQRQRRMVFLRDCEPTRKPSEFGTLLLTR